MKIKRFQSSKSSLNSVDDLNDGDRLVYIYLAAFYVKCFYFYSTKNLQIIKGYFCIRLCKTVENRHTYLTLKTFET